MSALASHVGKSELAGRVFDDRQLADLVGGSAARRYALVNRALQDGSLLRLKRGLYVLQDHSRTLHPFPVAQSLMPGSYVSFETALSHHGWIPEAVYLTASVSPGRKTLGYETAAFGAFAFHPLALEPYCFLVSVEREMFGELTAFVARPLRALMDLVAFRKAAWSGLDWITSGLRIEKERLSSLSRRDFQQLEPVYKHKTARSFIANFELELLGHPSPSRKGRSV